MFRGGMEENQSSNNTDLEYLNSIKRKALEALVPTLSDINDVEPDRKFNIYLSAIRFTHKRDLFEGAFELATQIEDPSSRSDALMELVQELNYTISELEDEPPKS